MKIYILILIIETSFGGDVKFIEFNGKPNCEKAIEQLIKMGADESGKKKPSCVEK